MKNRVPTEFEEQTKIFYWSKIYQSKYPVLKYLNSSLNGIRLTQGQARKAKMAGLMSGYPDIFLPYNNGKFNGLFIELKRQKKSVSRVSEEQKDFIIFLNKQGFFACVCYGAEDAINTITAYLENKIKGKQK